MTDVNGRTQSFALAAHVLSAVQMQAAMHGEPPMQQEAAPPDALLSEIARMTRGVHDAIRAIEPEWKLDGNSSKSSARDSLDYVVSLTEQAAHRTMDLVERAVPIAETIARDMRSIQALGSASAMNGQMALKLESNALQAEQLQSVLTDILMAQDYQDLSGQIIRRVANLLRDVEARLFQLVKVAAQAQALTGMPADDLQLHSSGASRVRSGIEAEGPIIHDGTRLDVVQGQDEVDDLLSKLGF